MFAQVFLLNKGIPTFFLSYLFLPAICLFQENYVRKLSVEWFVWLLASLDTWSMTEVITSVLQRLGDDIDPNNIPQILVLFKTLYFIFLRLSVYVTLF